MMAVRTSDVMAVAIADLSAWAAERGGRAHLAADPWHAMELLGDASDGWRVALLWNGTECRGQEAVQETVVAHDASAVVLCDPGLSAASPAYVFLGSGLRPPLLTLAENVNSRILSWRFHADAVHRQRWFHMETRPFAVGDTLMRGAIEMRYRFTIRTAKSEAETPLEVPYAQEEEFL